MTFHERYVLAAATTLLVELAVVLLVAWRLRLLVSTRRLAATTLLANALTHPALWYVPYFLMPRLLTPPNYPLYLVVGEASVLVVETAVYWLLVARHRPWLALALAALANAGSYAAGLVIWTFVG